MKKTLLLLAVLLGLGFAWYYIQDEDDIKVAKIMEDRGFSVDEDEIAKVVITEKNGKVSVLTHKKDIWFIGDERISRNQKRLLLEALTKVGINNIPPKGAYPSIMKTIAKIGILVQVFDHSGERIRSYYVGGVPQGERGTYYLMDGYSQPYLVELPGMEGSTRGRFVKRHDRWLDRAMFRYPNKDISKISVEYPRAKNKSFVVDKINGSFEVSPFNKFTDLPSNKQNDKVLDNYLENYYIGFFTEAYENNHPMRDSIIEHMNPYAKMRITNDAGSITSLDLYVQNEVYGNKGVALGPDNVDKYIERYFVNVNDGENFMLTQHLLAKKFLWGYDFFFR